MAEEPSALDPHASPLGQSLIPIVNKLQDICAQSGIALPIDLPQVAVVGSQSSGKSSVLEALVGRDFLPRGPEICTRRPLVLQLIQTKKGADGQDGEEYGELLHIPNRKFYDFSDIRREIQAETEREAGGNKGVSDRPIRLKIYSPNVLDIALVDLPGITKVPVGDQPADIEARIRTMILHYIRPRSCVILAVTAANSDLSNSDALQIAGNVDPDGSRTIGVITKLDIMDRGTDARNLLLGKVIPLRLGYIGVVNRSQEKIMVGQCLGNRCIKANEVTANILKTLQDIKHNKSIKEALAAEENFFRSHPVYVSLADQCGIPRLAKKLNQILVQHIRDNLPELKSRISSQLISVTKEYMSYGEVTESKGKNQAMSTSELSGGARIHYIFQSIFVRRLEEVNPLEDISDEDIRITIQNARGPRSAVFALEIPFEVLVRKQISRLLDPSLQCARFIYNELVKMSRHSLTSELQRFPVLKRQVDEVTSEFLRENLEPAQSIITHIIQMEMDYINTSHPNFVGGATALEMAEQQIRSSRVATLVPRQRDGREHDTSSQSRPIVARSPANGFIRPQANGVINEQGARANADSERNRATGSSMWGISSIFVGRESRQSARESSSSNGLVNDVEHSSSIIHLREPPTILRASENPSEQEATEIAATKLLLMSYFDIVRKNIENLVPKAIMHFLVNHTKRELHNVLIARLYRDNLLDEMLKEPEEVAIKRKRAQETLKVLQQAFQTLDELPLEVEHIKQGNSFATGPAGLPRTGALSSIYTTKFY